MTFELPDGARIELPDGATGADVAAAIGPGLARAALAIEVGGVMYDLDRPLPPAGARRSSPRAAARTRWTSSATTPPTSWPPRSSSSTPG